MNPSFEHWTLHLLEQAAQAIVRDALINICWTELSKTKLAEDIKWHPLFSQASNHKHYLFIAFIVRPWMNLLYLQMLKNSSLLRSNREHMQLGPF